MAPLFRLISKASIIFLVSIALIVPVVSVEARKPTPPDTTPSPEKALSFLRGQISTVGLLDSYVEDNTDYSYTYDDALAAMAFISAGDFVSARRILDAFVAIGPQPEGGFLHRYHATDGSPYGTLSVGHNAYLLQAMNLYYLETGDSRYNLLAQEVANYILSQQDIDGGIFGRAGVTWKSTESNLGALSAIHNLGKVQNIPYYIDRANAIRNFLITECWDGVRFLCGENDPMIVTDVQALGGMVLGPSYANGAYWVENYTRTTKRYSGRKTITGFDFNADRDTVWIEGTLQETMAFFVAGDITKYSFYKTESEKLFQSSGALLLASNTGTTGFDWILERWQAVAPTAWYIYACNQDNVLELLP
ncbi:MAG: hypothetical protein ABH847_01995 [Candidatus Omnitrophota bacterium]